MSHGPIKRELILAKKEALYGTDAEPAGTNAVLVRNITYAPDRLRMVARGAVRRSLGELQQVYGGSLQAISFECEVKGSGAAGTPPEISALLQACGVVENVTASTSVVYAPTSGDHASCTIYYFEAGATGSTQVRHILVGCRGNAEIVWQAGDVLLVRFSMIGRRKAAAPNPTDQSLPIPTYQDTVPTAIRGMSTNVGGVTGLVPQGYTLDFGNELSVSDDLDDAEGYAEIVISSRDPTLELRRHNALVSKIKPWEDLRAGTARAFSSGNLGGEAGNKITLTAGQMHYRNIAQGEEQGVRTGVYTFGLHENVEDDEFALTFT